MTPTQKEAVKELQKILKPMDTVYTILKHTSSSGMSRVIDCYVIKKNYPVWIGYKMSKALEYKWNVDKRGLNVRGAGMDMGFAIVYNLARVLFKGGDGKTITGRNGDKKPEKDGGYLLKQAWL